MSEYWPRRNPTKLLVHVSPPAIDGFRFFPRRYIIRRITTNVKLPKKKMS
jgi:hypothetical protein